MDSKVVVITGASAGIGAELARQLGAQGHKLVLAARREDALLKIAGETGALAAVADVRRRRDVENLREAALKKFGQVDVWINNAGRGIGKKVLELSEEDFDEMVAVNLKSAWYGIMAILPHFQSRKAGQLINVSSFLGRVPLATFRSAYSAAKAALNVLTANLRVDLQKEYPNIFVSLVMPGIVTTDFRHNALGGTPEGPPSGAAPKPQTAEEVAAAIAGLIEHPQAEIYTNPALAELVHRYYADVEAFEKKSRGGK